MIKIEGDGQFSLRIAPQGNAQTSPEASLTPAKYRDEGWAELPRSTSQLWSKQSGYRWSQRRRRQHRPRCWPAGTWCWRTPAPAPHTSSQRGRRQQPSIWEKRGNFYFNFYISSSRHPPSFVLRYFETFLHPILNSFNFQHWSWALWEDCYQKYFHERLTNVDIFVMFSNVMQCYERQRQRGSVYWNEALCVASGSEWNNNNSAQQYYQIDIGTKENKAIYFLLFKCLLSWSE